MRVGFFGDGPWAHQALDRIIGSDNYELTYIVARYPNPDPVLRQRSDELGLQFHCVENVNDTAFVEMVAESGANVNVSMSFDQIIRKELRESVEGGFLNCHAGNLPFYRGRNVINWALINAEKRLGITVHYVDDGVDTGDIVSQRFIAISDSDNYGTLLDKAVVECGEALFEALEMVRRGSAVRIDQATIHPVGTYFGIRGQGDEWIDWTWPADRVAGFIRGITTPGPGARTWYRGRPIAILNAGVVPGAIDHIGKEGQIVGRKKGVLTVKVGDSVVRASELREITEEGNLGDYMAKLPRIGERLGRDVLVQLEVLSERIARLESKFQS